MLHSVGIFIFIRIESFMLRYVQQGKNTIDSILRFISKQQEKKYNW